LTVPQPDRVESDRHLGPATQASTLVNVPNCAFALIEQMLYVVRNQLPGIEANVHLIGRPFKAAKSIVHVALASGAIVRSSEKSVCKTHTKVIAAIFDLLN